MSDVRQAPRAKAAPQAGADNNHSGPQLSVAERQQRGRDARARAPRSSHARFEPWPGRPDPVDLLEEQAVSRVPELVPVRHGRMAASPFTFFRGAALVMASDLSSTESTGIKVQCCGDAHLSNFGAFGSPERNLVFDVNDFDETLPGPWEWDVKRLAASFAIAGRDRGFLPKERRRVVLNVGRSYRESMAEFAASRHLDVWYKHLNLEQLLARYGPQIAPQARKQAEKTIAKARLADSMKALDQLTAVVDGERKIVSDPPVLVPVEELYPGLQAHEITEGMRQLIRGYQRTLPSDRRHIVDQFRFIQIARKVVGVGSVGTRAWVVLLLGRDDTDPLILQAKEAQDSVLAQFVGKSKYSNQGQRVVAGQHLMQAHSDIFLGWERVTGFDGQHRDFYVRQLRDWKGSANTDQMTPDGMGAYAQMCAWTLSRAHARSGDRVAIAAYLGNSTVFDQAIADFAETYADQNERDFARFKEAITTGRVKAAMGV
jgi:uncharacterized protein (DUF2252 family)